MRRQARVIDPNEKLPGPNNKKRQGPTAPGRLGPDFEDGQWHDAGENPGIVQHDY